jgi:cellulose synthase/poly-beta-1,6-N-acetylglucosamine synthase-like glycosyltransferase
MVRSSQRSPFGPLAFVAIVAAAVATAAAGAAAATVFVVASIQNPSFLNLLYVALSLLLGAVGWLTLIWTLLLWGEQDLTGDSGADGLFGEHFDPAHFSLTLPAPREETELEATLSRLVENDYPLAHVRVVVGDDPVAREVAERAVELHPDLVNVVVDRGLFELMSGDMGRGEAEEPGRASLAATWLARALGRRELRRGLVGLLGLVVAAAMVALSLNTASFVYIFYIGVSLILGVVACTTLVWMLDAWRTPASLAESRLKRENLEPAHSFSLIVPARHEEAVLETTLSRLVQTDHPAFEVLAVVGDDDPATRDVAERLAERHPGIVKVVLDDSSPKSKPKALNTALPQCTGEITGVFDAEDDVHPALLERVDQCFQSTGADVVQAGVQLMNFRSSWLTVRNVLEYYFWFRSRLHLHARQGFIPLGGNTVFVRTSVLRAVSGWDPECLAEDCELGVRLSSLGAPTAVFYEPELVTREECPPTVRAFARQRTRWNQGYLQTLRKGYWRRLPLQQRALGLYILGMPYLMAIAWLLIPLALTTAVVVKAPVPITLVSFLPAVPMLSMLAAELAGIGDFCRAYGERPSARDYRRLILGLPLYQAVLAYAAARAVVREARGDRGWEKTAHFGLHLKERAEEQIEVAVRAPAPLANRPRRAGAAGAATSVLELHPPAPPRASHFGSSNGSSGLNGSSANGSGSLAPPSIGPIGPAAGRGEPLPAGVLGVLRRGVASRADLLLQVALLAGVGVVLGTGLLHWPASQFDEGTYITNAWAVQHGALAPYTYGYGHPPLTWLFISLWTWVNGIFGQGTYSVDSGREFMFVVNLVSCSLVYTLARRLGMGRAFAAGAVVLFGLSPLGVYFHRAVLLDNVAIAWVLAAIVLALTPRRRLWAFAASGGCFAAALLCKETTLILFPALIVAVAQNADGHTRRYCLTLFASFLALMALTYPLYATLKGELLPGRGHVSLMGSTILQLFAREGTGSLFDPQSQTHAIVTAWLKLDPWLLGIALALSPIALLRRSMRAVTLACLIQVVMVLRPGYLPNMYVIGVLPFAALVVAGATEALWNGARAGRFRLPVWPVRAAVASLVVALTVAVAPGWARIDHAAMTTKPDAAQRAAERWLVDHVGHDKRLIVGDEFWIYLVEHGFDHQPVKGGFFSQKVVVYWPLDYDPAVKKRFPGAWRDFDYIVSTEAVRSTLKLTPTTAQALDHSRVLVQFGRGEGRIEIRAIDRGAA